MDKSQDTQRSVDHRETGIKPCSGHLPHQQPFSGLHGHEILIISDQLVSTNSAQSVYLFSNPAETTHKAPYLFIFINLITTFVPSITVYLVGIAAEAFDLHFADGPTTFAHSPTSPDSDHRLQHSTNSALYIVAEPPHHSLDGVWPSLHLLVTRLCK